MSVQPSDAPAGAGGTAWSPAETVHRLLVEFADATDRATITRVVLSCRQALCTCPGAALPELVERLAREELADLTGGRAARAPATRCPPDPDRPRWRGDDGTPSAPAGRRAVG